MKLRTYLQICIQRQEWQGGGIVYPSATGYRLTVETGVEFADETLANGDKLILLQGCFLYKSLNISRHSYFCYFYKKGSTELQNLSICENGHYAD
jgi:hypothetical protein